MTIGQIDSAIKKSKPLPANLLLYRGQDFEEFRVGGTFQRKGYTSTSVSLDEARKFDKGALLVIKIPQKGFPGILMGQWEEEVLLPRNTTFKVLKVQTTGDENLVYVEPCIGSCK
ncbi:ADP-ribosyltransferase exoenzyme [compost metagenome]